MIRDQEYDEWIAMIYGDLWQEQALQNDWVNIVYGSVRARYCSYCARGVPIYRLSVSTYRPLHLLVGDTVPCENIGQFSTTAWEKAPRAQRLRDQLCLKCGYHWFGPLRLRCPNCRRDPYYVSTIPQVRH